VNDFLEGRNFTIHAAPVRQVDDQTTPPAVQYVFNMDAEDKTTLKDIHNLHVQNVRDTKGVRAASKVLQERINGVFEMFMEVNDRSAGIEAKNTRISILIDKLAHKNDADI
jgi:hypothetical protein